MNVHTNTMEFSIGGMHCAACSSRIERVVGALPGVARVSVSLAANSARVEGLEQSDAPALREMVIQTVADLGFSATPVTAGDGSLSETAARWEAGREKERQNLAARRRELFPSFACALPLLVLSMGAMAGMPLPDILEPALSPLPFALAQLALCLPVLWTGRRFFLLGLPALWRKTPTMDSLVALGTGAAFLFSLWNTLTQAVQMQWGERVIPRFPQHGSSGIWDMLFGTGHGMGVELYYESAAMVIALVSLGKYLEARSRMRSSEAVKGLLELAPETALRLVPPFGAQTLLSGAGQEEVPLASVRPGDLLLVRPGGRIPVDGAVLEGTSFVDESMLTGESMPVGKVSGSPLTGGTMNREGMLVMRAERVGADTALAHIIHMVREAQGSKAPVAGMADRVSLYFVPVVMGIAMLAGLGWWIFGDSAAFAVRVFISVLVIACPCAMGLATPISIMVGTGRGAQLGVLFRNGEALENASRVTAMVLDKTGTLTLGRPALTDILPMGERGSIAWRDETSSTLLRVAASLEAASEHPLAKALVEKAEEKGLTLWPVENFLTTPGKGVEADVLTDGGRIRASIGNAAFTPGEESSGDMRNRSGGIPELHAVLAKLAGEGKTPVFLTLDGIRAAVFAVADPVRPEAAGVVSALNGMGVTCAMLTGDNAVTAQAVAADVGIDRVTAGVLPEGKAEFISALKGEGKVVGMTGDGINDAPALALADVGFAMRSGIDVAVETGDVILMRHGLHGLPVALGLARAVMRNIRENLFWAFAYNIIGIPFAAGIAHIFGGPVLSPMLAGAAMAFSSVSVVANALRLRFFRG